MDLVSSVRSSSRNRALPTLILVAAAALLAVACGGGGPDPARVAEGKALFLKTCASCHGPDARGMPKLGKSLWDNPFVQARSDRELVEFIKIGRRPNDPLNTTGVDMPPRGGNPALTDEDLAKIITFVQTLQDGSGG